MKDRQFMAVLGLVVAAGLVMGLIAFRMTAGSTTIAANPVANAAAANPNAPRPSAADEQIADTGSSPTALADAQANGLSMRDGESPDVATPEPAPPPPPPPPVATTTEEAPSGSLQ